MKFSTSLLLYSPFLIPEDLFILSFLSFFESMKASKHLIALPAVVYAENFIASYLLLFTSYIVLIQFLGEWYSKRIIRTYICKQKTCVNKNKTVSYVRFLKANSFFKPFGLLAAHWFLWELGAKCIENAYLSLHRHELFQWEVQARLQLFGMEGNNCTGKKKRTDKSFFMDIFSFGVIVRGTDSVICIVLFKAAWYLCTTLFLSS